MSASTFGKSQKINPNAGYEDKAGKLVRKHLVTTLLDAEKYPWEELVSLYLERWDIELRFRDIKTTMGFEALNVKTPQMAHKSITMAMIGCNLIKALSQEADWNCEAGIRNVSFQGVLDEIVSNAANFRFRVTHHHKRKVDESHERSKSDPNHFRN